MGKLERENKEKGNEEKKIVVGLSEEIEIEGEKYEARVDTGAKRSSVCKSIAKKIELGPPIKKVKTRSVHGKSKRPVVKARVVLKGKEMVASFSVYDRKEMSYPVLIGRNILKRGFIINPKK